jgi:hypothetical protein
MSTAYRDAVLVDAPLVYLRLDETGAAAHLMEIEDSSGNGRHGGLYYVDSSGTYEPLGHPSGIETDSDSSGFLSKSAAASDQGSVWVPGTSSAMKPAGDCAVEAWVRVGPNYSFATSDPYWVAGKGVLVGLRSTSGMYFAAGITVGGVTHWITATGIAPQAGAWYHLVATRVGTSFNLYVNGAFVDSAAVGAGSNDHTDDPFRCGHNSLAGQESILDEVAYYGAGLSAGRVLAHYQAAKNTLALSGESQGRSTAVLSSETARAAAGFPFHPNLDFDVREGLEFKTTAILSRDAHEQRQGIYKNPRRTLEYVISTHGPGKVRRLLHSTLFGRGHGPYKIPVIADATAITGGLSAGATSISLATEGRDYDVGKPVWVWQDEDSYEYVTCSAVNANSIGVSALANTYSGAVVVAPAREAHLLGPKVGIKSQTQEREDVTLEFTVSQSDLSTNRFEEWTPADTFNDVEVFTLYKARYEWLEPEEWGLERYEDKFDYGTGAYSVKGRATATGQRIGMTLTFGTRAKFAEFLGWWMYRAGRRVPLYLPTYHSDLVVAETFQNTLDGNFKIEEMGYAANYNANSARRDLCFFNAAGQRMYARVSAAVSNGDGTETLTISAAEGQSRNQAWAKVSFMPLVTLEADRIEIAYGRFDKGGAATVRLAFRELLYTPD